MIIVFSGCGNSLDVATRLGNTLGDSNIMHLKGDALKLNSIDATSERRIIWACPVYSWGLPPIFVDFINRISIEGGEKCDHYLVATCGDDAGLTHRQWRKLMKRKGLNAISSWTVIMPNTYTLMKGFDVDDAEVASRKLEKSVARIARIAEGIESRRKVDNVVRGKFAWVKSRIIYPWFKRFAMSPKPYHSTDGCTGCGKCSRECPLGNISMTDNRPAWGKNCAMCLRCYHICPTHSVAYGNSTATKHQYLNR